MRLFPASMLAVVVSVIATAFAGGAAYMAVGDLFHAGIAWAGIAGVAAAAVVFATFALYLVYRLTQDIRELREASSVFEADIARKFDRLGKDLDQRGDVSSLAEQIAGIEHALAQGSYTQGTYTQGTYTEGTHERPDDYDIAAQRGSQLEPGDDRRAHDRRTPGKDDKVIQLVSGNRDVVEQTKRTREAALRRNRLTHAIEDGALELRLQPVIDLSSQNVVMLEATAWINDEEDLPLNLHLAGIDTTGEQARSVDRAMLNQISTALDKLAANDELMPVCYRFVSRTSVFSADNGKALLKGSLISPAMRQNLLPGVSVAGDRANANTIRQAVTVLRSAFDDIALWVDGQPNSKNAAQIARTLQAAEPAAIMVPAQTLLSYPSKSSRRLGEMLAVDIANQHDRIVATQVSEAHVLGSVLDLDVQRACGDYLTPAKAVRHQDGPAGNMASAISRRTDNSAL